MDFKTKSYKFEFGSIKVDDLNSSMILSTHHADSIKLITGCKRIMSSFRLKYPNHTPFVSIKVVPFKSEYVSEKFKLNVDGQVIEENLEYETEEIDTVPLSGKEMQLLQNGKLKEPIIQDGGAKTTARKIIQTRSVKVSKEWLTNSDIQMEGIISENIFNVLHDESIISSLDPEIVGKLAQTYVEKVKYSKKQESFDDILAEHLREIGTQTDVDISEVKDKSKGMEFFEKNNMSSWVDYDSIPEKYYKVQEKLNVLKKGLSELLKKDYEDIHQKHQEIMKKGSFLDSLLPLMEYICERTTYDDNYESE